jgi:hypothetical protein
MARAPPLQGGGRGFETLNAHHIIAGQRPLLLHLGDSLRFPSIILSINLAGLPVKGSLRRRSEGVWQARVYAGLDTLSGKRRYAARTILRARAEHIHDTQSPGSRASPCCDSCPVDAAHDPTRDAFCLRRRRRGRTIREQSGGARGAVCRAPGATSNGDVHRVDVSDRTCCFEDPRHCAAR